MFAGCGIKASCTFNGRTDARGYRSNEEKVSLFTAPTDPARLAEWESKIKRADRRLTPKAVVCERHFESGYIERYFQTTVNGVVNEIARDKPRLKPDAVPTIFEDYPTHLVPKKAVIRKLIVSRRPHATTEDATLPLAVSAQDISFRLVYTCDE
ncbi:hypothetical protein HPB48_027135 [Haemaphysalis longicornis]|uniref:THAP-type domain-containing protein n=1 Tax=Haemaphysalis longicornis TaxID=44386 RepID=A0A9J6H360_HAELO|nr:hypothetical protein HPB48_027135 [Haemaphysalis longicornis]